MVLNITGVRQRRRVVPASKTGAKAESGSNPTAPANVPKLRLFHEDGKYLPLGNEIDTDITYLLQGYLRDKSKLIDHSDLRLMVTNAVEMIMLKIRLDTKYKRT